MAKVPSAVVAAGGIVGGYGVARWTRKRQLGGVVLVAAGAAAARQWREQAGGKAAGALTAAYVAAFAGSHPWPRRWAPGLPSSGWRARWPWRRGRSPTGTAEPRRRDVASASSTSTPRSGATGAVRSVSRRRDRSA